MGSSESAEMASTRRAWKSTFEECLDHDDWGHVIEADEGYDGLARAIWNSPRDELEPHEQKLLRKLVICLKLRSLIIRTCEEGIGCDSMRKLKPVLDNAMRPPMQDKEFPIDLTQWSAKVGVIEAELDCVEATGMIQNMDLEGNSVAESGAAQFVVDGTAIVLSIDRIGLKDAQTAGYINPQVKITVVGEDGEALEEAQETSQGCNTLDAQDAPQHIMFNNHSVPLRTSLEELTVNPGCAIFFEFNHYKPDAKKVSCKCYAFMDFDEIKEGHVVLELCKCEKPTNFARDKEPTRLSVKDHLNFHLDVQFRV